MTTENPSNKTPINNDRRRQEGTDYMKILFQVLMNWHWFLLVLSLAVIAAWLYQKNTFPTWRITSTVLIESDSPERSIIESDPMLKGFGLRPGMQNLDNQVNILTS